MGRGRAKAKQTKVARELKYRAVDTDFSSLERELRGEEATGDTEAIPEAYADLAEEYEQSSPARDDDYGDLRKSG
ncbi:DUF3073 domain-containing protein [Microlunatus elymi]|uniref:DUF3073 domain-containing protein n=1 Tax=Microlunatus elymi TaxID=2596828 RepID=A0A516Q4Q5_9ACTN|nr:DUF3073 domain-containing protein [Microlunatus elymi]QDP98394.1 DUF3073 domain-containing protein [Microlunatus elymi]